MDRYEYLIELGKNLAPYDPKYRTDDCLIDGCQSRVWIYSVADGDRIRFFADSDAIITKGMISLLVRLFSNQRPADIAAADLYFIDKIGLSDNLTPTRSNGLASMVAKMRLMAVEMQNNVK
jgi:cysteine desulfuration protein SufE